MANETCNMRIERQVRLVAGTVITAGLVLGLTVAPAWFALTGWVAFMMFVSALTGFCPMETILPKMPWNRPKLNEVAR